MKLFTISIYILFVLLNANAELYSRQVDFGLVIKEPQKIDAKAVVVMDMANGEVLYEYNADMVLPPASLTKIMTMLVGLNAVKDGQISLQTRIYITKTDATLPYRSSLMYLQEGMNVTFDDLLKGMAVVSGNDAAITTARVVSGSTPAFVDLMNKEAKKLGLKETYFVEPSGLSELNKTTAYEMALLARHYIKLYPDAVKKYNSQTSMHFPRADVMPDGVQEPDPPIILRSTNKLLFTYQGCDGLKTGYIDEVGFNLVATAERDGSRFIMVSLGGQNGIAAREQTGKTLLDWAFSTWKTVSPKMPALPEFRAWGGKTKFANLVLKESPSFTVPLKLANNITSRIELPVGMNAPIEKGAKLGSVVFSSEGRVLRRIDIISENYIPKGNIFIQLKDAIIKFFTKKS